MPYSDFTHQSVSPFEENRLVGFVNMIGRPIGLLTMVLGLLPLVGYAIGAEALYRPIENGPATNPLTALIVSLIAFGFEFNTRRLHRFLPLLISLLALFLCLIHCYCILSKAGISKNFTPFYSVVESDIASGKDNSMGLNTTTMLLLLTLSHLMYYFKHSMVSQFLAFTALCIPMVSITGYLYGISFLYGHMSLLSTVFGILLCISALTVTADKGGLRALLSPYIGGKIARRQMFFGNVIPFLAGFWVVRSLENSNQNSLFGMYVVAMCWFIVLVVMVSAVLHEKVDLQRRTMERKLYYSATTDALTTLPNRLTFMKKAEERQAASSHNQTPLWCLMLDIDHFKWVNDSAGHLVGDKVLVAFATALKRFVRPEDLVCRFGGEEFALLLNNMDRDQVAELAEKIRCSASNLHIRGYTEDYGAVTISIGCAQLNHDQSISGGLNLADRAMYHAKETGRNKVSFLEENTLSSDSLRPVG